MQLNFTKQELSFLMKQIGCELLPGFEAVEFDPDATAKALAEKGYVTLYREAWELSNPARLLLTAWARIRFTVVRQDYIMDDHTFALLADPRFILTVSIHFDQITVGMMDFDFLQMRKLLIEYIGLPGGQDAVTGYNIVLSGDQFLDTLNFEQHDDAWVAAQLGLPVAEIEQLKSMMADEASVGLIIQDLQEEVGCMTAISAQTDAWYMLKHVVPNTDPARHKVVLVKGSAEDITDSIFAI